VPVATCIKVNMQMDTNKAMVSPPGPMALATRSFFLCGAMCLVDKYCKYLQHRIHIRHCLPGAPSKVQLQQEVCVFVCDLVVIYFSPCLSLACSLSRAHARVLSLSLVRSLSFSLYLSPVHTPTRSTTCFPLSLARARALS